MNKLSVIIPTFNVEKYINKCLDSIVNQTLKDIEIIITDDGSTDKTPDIIKKYAKNDSRFVILLNSNSSGNSGTPRNQALERAKGEYIAFVDSDDWIDPGMFQDFYKRATETQADIVSGNGFYKELPDGSTENIKITNNFYHPKHQPNRANLYLNQYFPIVWNRIYRSKFIKENRIKFGETKTSADLPFAFKALLLANSTASIENKYYHYRFDRPNSTIERRKGEDSFEIFKAYESVIKTLNEKKCYENYITHVIYKALQDYQYNTNLLQENLKESFTQKMSAFIARHHKNIQDKSIFGPKTSELLSKLSILGEPLISGLDNNSGIPKDRPSISVIVPAHNSGKYIGKCLSSLSSQALKEIEIIVINDGSSDNTLEIIKSHAAKDHRIKIIDCNTASGNPGVARNIGIHTARGEYIGFVDSDDWIESSMFEELLKKANEADFEIVSTTGFIKKEGNTSNKINFKYITIDQTKKNNKDAFQSGYFSNVWNRIYSRAFLLKHDIYFPHIYISEDFCFSFACHALAKRTAKKEGCYYNYLYDRPESTTSSRKGKKGFSIISSFEEELQYFKQLNIYEDFLPQILHKKLNSFWYTYERLHKELKEQFLEEMKSLFIPFANDLDFNLFTDQEVKKLKLINIEPNINNTNSTKEIHIKERNTEPDLFMLKKANHEMAARNFEKAKSIYAQIDQKFDSAILNSAIINFLSKDIISTKINIAKLRNKNLAKPLIKTICNSLKANERLAPPPTETPLVSIIVPVHNTSLYLEKCLSSIINQSYKNLHIIIINDGSTDNSESIIEKYVQGDSRINLIHRNIASGNPGTPRNEAIEKAIGYYTAFIDSDDWISQDYIEKLVKAAQCGADITFTSGYIIKTEEKEFAVKYNNNNFNDPSHPFYKFHESFTIWDKLYKTSFLRENSIKLGETKAAVDIPFIFKAYYYCNMAAYCNDNIGYFYRKQSATSVTLNKRRKTNCNFEFLAYENVQEWLSSCKIPNWYKDLVDIKKVNSYLYTLSIIGDEFKDEFLHRARKELLQTDAYKVCNYLLLMERTKNLEAYKKIIRV